MSSRAAAQFFWTRIGFMSTRDGDMSVFSDTERKYLESQRLGRLATVGPDGMPHVVPVNFCYNPRHDTIDIGGRITSWGLDGQMAISGRWVT
jgi:nitroimidazol reductase NimA-like FMN-containing flavoprotein (pyridoxamine 5'-phosphate oxidase superfamily)